MNNELQSRVAVEMCYIYGIVGFHGYKEFKLAVVLQETFKPNSKMKQEFFKYLPSEIITDILSRLPVGTIFISKCVCKTWLHLLETHEFVHSHLARSVPGLAVLSPEMDSSTCSCTIFEFEDGLNLERHDLHYNPLTKFDFPPGEQLVIEGSANGLLLLRKLRFEREAQYYICNPITRDYIELHFSKEPAVKPHSSTEELLRLSRPVVTYGFGMSKISGQYKAVRIFHDNYATVNQGRRLKRINPKSECYVYTLGIGSWRSIEPGAPFRYNVLTFGALFNGNLHWFVWDLNDKGLISCFDLETECFSTFSTPSRNLGWSGFLGALSALGDCLCLCDYMPEREGIVIWLMEEYGKSWTKKYVIRTNGTDFGFESHDYFTKPIYPIKVFKDGDILMLWEEVFHIFYSGKTETTGKIGIFKSGNVSSMLLTPSLLSLKSFGMENVVSF